MTQDPAELRGVPLVANRLVEYAEGAIVSRTILQRESGNVTLFAFDAGQGLSEHTAPFDALVFVLEGRAAITIGGQASEVAAGGMVIMPAQVPHALKAIERFKMMLVMIRG